MTKRAGGAGPSQPQKSPSAPVKAPAARPTKAALPHRTAGQEDAGRRPAPCQGAARPGPGIITKESPSPAAQTGMGLHTANGARKYLTAGERDAFLRQAELADRPVRILCMTLAYAGCRLPAAGCRRHWR